MDAPVRSVQVKVFKDNSKDFLLLHQSIYGAKQSHHQFNVTSKKKLASIGFHSAEVDDSLYPRWIGNDFVHIDMHVDDGLVVSYQHSLIVDTRNILLKLHDFKWSSMPTEHLGIKIRRNRAKRLIHLLQKYYLQGVLDHFRMEHSNPVSTPLLHSTRLPPTTVDNGAAHSESPYRKIVGFLNHAAVNTRPDILRAVSQLAQHLSCYGSAHITSAKHLPRYVKGTLERGLLFRKTSVDSRMLSGYADADYANDVSTRW